MHLEPVGRVDPASDQPGPGFGAGERRRRELLQVVDRVDRILVSADDVTRT